jgi:hypothetical protein
MQIPPVSLDSLLPAANPAAPPSAEGGGFAQALQANESALRSPPADAAGKSPKQEKSLAGRGDGEARQASDDGSARFASRERSAGAAAAPPDVNLSAVASLAGSETEAVPIPAEMALPADFPAPEPAVATALESPPTFFTVSPGEPSRDAALLLSAPASADPGKFVTAPQAMTPERGASAPLSAPPVEGATPAIPKREDMRAAQHIAPAANLAPSDAKMTASAVLTPEAAPQGETPGRTVLVETSELTARGQADAPPRVSPPAPEFVGTGPAGGLKPEGEVLSKGTNKSAIPASARKDQERALSPPEFRPGSAGGQAASAPAPESPLPVAMRSEEAAPAVDLAGRAASPSPPELRPGSAGGQVVSSPAAEVPLPGGMRADAVSTPETIPAPSSTVSESVSQAQIITGRAGPEPVASPVADRPIRQEGAAPLPGLRSGDGAVIESLRVTAPAIPASPTGPATQVLTEPLIAAAVPAQEMALPVRLREDLRGTRLDTSSDRRFAQLLGETRGAPRVPIVAGESLPVTDVGKGEGAELLFREPGAQGEPGIFRVAADNGSNPPLFSVAGQGVATTHAASSGSGTPAAAMPFTLPVPEEQVYQQVASRLTLVGGERHSRMTMRLYPEELGQVKLDLTVAGDRVRLHLHAQNQQVQEVLEKYLPRLRESFEQQGLKLEDAQVTSDSPGQGGRGSFQESRQSLFAARSSGHSAGRMAGEEEPVISPPPSPVNPRPGGISVRV